MMEETYLVDHIKEVSCFVSQDLSQDLSDAKAGRHSLTYVLPDGISNDRGYIRTPLTKDERRATKDGKDVRIIPLVIMPKSKSASHRELVGPKD